MTACTNDACVAQLVEQRIRNAQVAGSSPAASSIKPRLSNEKTGFFVIFLPRAADCAAKKIMETMLAAA